MSNWYAKTGMILAVLCLLQGSASAAGFGSASNYAAGPSPSGIAFGDFNGDGKPDLVVANLNSSFVSVFLNRGMARFSLR